MERLLLRENEIDSIDNNYFSACKNLKWLDLSLNWLTEIPNLHFISKTLYWLLLSNNQINQTNALENQVQIFPTLNRVELVRNQIEDIGIFKIREKCPKLTALMLNENQLSEFPDVISYDDTMMKTLFGTVKKSADVIWDLHLCFTQNVSAES